MTAPEINPPSRWIIRAIEWDDARARYPNLFREGMPRHLLVMDRVASRLRLGDLVAPFYPTSQRHPERSESFLGLARVVGLRRGDVSGFAWVDLETAHRFDPPLRIDRAPRRVFLCCDPGWPAEEVALFDEVFAAAVAAGFEPAAGEAAPTDDEKPIAPPGAASEGDEPSPPVGLPSQPGAKADQAAAAEHRSFAGVSYSGDMRDPRDGTWLAVSSLDGERLRVSRLASTGRHGLEALLRDPDQELMHSEAIGLDFPFAMPIEFAKVLLGGSFPESGWWALVKRLEGLSRPAFLDAVHEFRESKGDLKRLTDDVAGRPSPLDRESLDVSPKCFHGIRMIGEDRSRYAVRPFETAQGRLLLEVDPTQVTTSLEGPGSGSGLRRQLAALDPLPVDVDPSTARHCRKHPAALAAVVASRAAAAAVISGETERSPEELAPGQGDRVRVEGWIYGRIDRA